MFQKIINFVKYHNAFAIGISLVLVLTFSAMASEDVRNAVIGEEIITEQGIDNSQLLSADLENFNINLKINNILEDEENYYVDYTFNTIAVRDNIWQPVIKVEKFTVNKTALGNRDLGIYLAEELSEVARGEMAYLKEAQKNERGRGRTQIVRTTDYTGLIGLTLDLKNKILPGYEPVVKPPVAEIVQEPIVQEPVCQPTDEVCDGLDNDCDGIVDNPDICQIATTTEATTTPTTTEPVCQPTEEVCDGVDNNCNGETDENVDCGLTSCDASKNLIGECQNTCVDGVCQTCAPTCVCAEGFYDCDGDGTCETQGQCPIPELEPEPDATTTAIF